MVNFELRRQVINVYKGMTTSGQPRAVSSGLVGI
jgi:hypothetical protein